MSLPPGWVETTLGEVVEVNPKHDPATDRALPVSFVPMPAVDDETGAITDPTDRPLSEVWKGYTHFADADVLFAKITPCMENGKSALASGLTNGLACGSTEFYVFRSQGGIEPAYLWRFLRQKAFREEAAKVMTGAVGQRRVPRAWLEKLRLRMPPLGEQRRIVAKLDALTARLTRARVEAKRSADLAAVLRSNVVSSAFSGALSSSWRAMNHTDTASDDELTDAFQRASGKLRRKAASDIEWRPDLPIPDGWRWVSVDQVAAALDYGSSAKTSDDVDGVPVLRMGNIQDGRLDWTKLKYLPENHAEFPNLFLNPGDVLFNRTNSFELVGKSAIYGGETAPASFASYLIRVRCSGIRPRLLAWYLNSDFGRRWISVVASQQVGQANVNGSKLKALGVPLSSQGEQFEIERLITDAFARADRLEAEAKKALALIDRLEAAILARAFRGELVAQDPNDEPASVLLERIRSRRAAEPKAKRGRRPKLAS